MDHLMSTKLFISFDQLDGPGAKVDERNKGNLKRDLAISDLSKKVYNNSQSIYEKADMYWHCLLIISVYYSIPTIQMVLDTNAEYDSTGNQDLCYFNLQCTKPLGRLKDFGSTFSNLGYVVLGLLFISLARLKSSRFERIEEANSSFNPHLHGVPQQTGEIL